MKPQPQKVECDIIDRILSQITFETKIRVMLEMEWISMNIPENQYSTDEDISKAHKWATRLTKQIVKYKEETTS